MVSANTTFGASIVRSMPSIDDNRLQHPALESPALTPAVSRDSSLRAEAGFTEKAPPPHSPFYEHPPASHEAIPHSQSNGKTSKLNTNVFEKDVESGNITPLSLHDDQDPFTQKIAVEHNKEDGMWPSLQTLRSNRKQQKQVRRTRKGCTMCAPVANKWSTFTKRQRLYVKLAIALLLVGIAVGLGVGISAAVKGTYFVSDGSSQQVG